MIMTITNPSVTDALTVPLIRGITPETVIAATANATFGLNSSDLLNREPEGDRGWKRLNEMIKKGLATIAFAADPVDSDVVDEANEL